MRDSQFICLINTLRAILLFLAAIFFVLVLPAYGGGHSDPRSAGNEIVEPFQALPTPNKILDVYGQEVENGWILKYHNRMTQVTESLEDVPIVLPDGTPFKLTWTIISTPNFPCSNMEKEERRLAPEMCADTLTVNELPEGYIAIPQSVTVNEGGNAEILIIPGGMM